MSIAAEAREALYRECYPKVKRYVAARVSHPQEAEDLVSDIFLKVYQRLDTFDETKASVSTWVYAITRNAVIDYYRGQRHIAELPETLAAEGDLEDSFLRRDALEALAAALAALEERQRDIIILRYYRGMTLKAIADRMGLSYAYIKVLHNGALRALKQKLQ